MFAPNTVLDPIIVYVDRTNNKFIMIFNELEASMQVKDQPLS